MNIPARSLLLPLLLAGALAAQAADWPADRFGPADIARLADVAEPAFAPDGNTLAYSVEVSNLDEDRKQSDLWRVGYDGQDRTQLTATPKHDEWAPAWSPDGRWLAFLADRGEDEDAVTQVWVMPARGGEARTADRRGAGRHRFRLVSRQPAAGIDHRRSPCGRPARRSRRIRRRSSPSASISSRTGTATWARSVRTCTCSRSRPGSSRS